MCEVSPESNSVPTLQRSSNETINRSPPDDIKRREVELDSQESSGEIKKGRWSWTLKRAQVRSRAGTEVELDPQESSGEIKSREVELDPQESSGGIKSKD